MKLGWARVSTKAQHLELQLVALEKFGCDKILKGKISGKFGTAPELEEAISSLKKGDSLVVWHLDRLGRKARALINLEYELKLRGVALVSLTQNIDTSTARGELEFLNACVKAQEESVRISERTKAGMQAARLKGNYPGPRKCLNEKQVKRARRLYKKHKSFAAVARELQRGTSTVWRALQPEYTVERTGHHIF